MSGDYFDALERELRDAVRRAARNRHGHRGGVGRRWRQSRTVLVAGLGVATVVAAAVVAIVVLDHDRASPAESAFATRTLHRAAAVLAPAESNHTILHITATETLSPLAQHADRTTVSKLSEQAWLQQGPPWHERAIIQVPGGPVLEENSTGQIYNRTTNTLYPGPHLPNGKPRYTLTPTGTGTYRLSVKLPHGGVNKQTLDANTAQALRDGTDTVTWSASFDAHTQTQTIAPIVAPSLKEEKRLQAQQPDAASTGFAGQLHGLLVSGRARVTRTTTNDGQPAIEISSVNPLSGPRTNYYVNPQTYAPIELDTFGYDSPKDVTRVQFSTYETLPLAGNQQLVKITVPADARTDHSPAKYWNATDLPRPF